MEAKEFLGMCHDYCADCRIENRNRFSVKKCFQCYLNRGVGDFTPKDADIIITIVEELNKKEEKRARQSEFLKKFPNAKKVDNTIDICPKIVDELYQDCNHYEYCTECKRAYWGGLINNEEKETN